MEASPPCRKRRVPSPETAAEALPPSLDSLPSEILEKIVSYLRLRDAVRTSALSRTWSHRWESVPGLRLTWCGAEPLAAVGAVLGRYACPVREFCYLDVSEQAFACSDLWIPALAGKGVQSLSLRFREYLDVDLHTLHPSIFSCGELTVLRLENCYLPAAPLNFAGFRDLTWLSLTTVGLPEHGERDLEAIIRLSPMLETLDLHDVWIEGSEFDEWVIRGSNLKSLDFVADKDYNVQIGQLPSLQNANVSIQNYNSVDRDFVKLLERFTQVRELEFHMLLKEVDALEGLSYSFQKLKGLILHVSSCNVPSILSIFSLLRNAPILEELEIKIVDSEVQNDGVDLNFFSALWTTGVFTNLKIFTMTDTSLWSNEMHFIELVLFKAKLLRALFVYQADDNDHSISSEEAVIQLTKFKRLSPKAKVFFRSIDDYWAHGKAVRKVLDV